MNVHDQEAVAEGLTLALQAEHAADGAARTIRDDKPIGLHCVFAVRRRYPHRDAIGLRCHAHDFVPPAQLRAGEFIGALDQELLDVILLQIDERGSSMSRFVSS